MEESTKYTVYPKRNDSCKDQAQGVIQCNRGTRSTTSYYTNQG